MPDIEQRLRDSAAEIAYPPTPNIARAVTNRLRTPPRGFDAHATRLTAHEGRSPGTTAVEVTHVLPSDRRRDGLPGQFARLAAAIVAFVIFGGLIALVFQTAGDPTDRPGGAVDASAVADDESTPARGPLVLVSKAITAPRWEPSQARPIDPATLQDLPNRESFPVGWHRRHAFSPDGRTLAAFIWPTQTVENGTLHFLDVPTWRERSTPIALDGRVSLTLFSADGTTLYWVAGDYVSGAFVLWRADVATATASIVTRFPAQVVPFEMRLMGENQLAVFGVPTDSNNLSAGDPLVIVFDLNTGALVADIPLEGIKAWQRRVDLPDGSFEYRIYRPGIAWDTERRLLYVVHPDMDAVTLVDLERGAIIETTTYAPSRSLMDRALDWLAPPVAAGPVPHTVRQALLSADGRSLYVVSGGHWSQNNWWEEDADRTGLQVIDTANLSNSVEVDLPRINTMLLSPDGELLILHTFEQSQAEDGRPMRTNDRIVALSTDDLQVRAAFDAGGVDYSYGGDVTETYTLHGISPDGTTLYVIRREYADGAQSGDIMLLDVASMTLTATRAFDQSYNSFVTLMTP